MVNMWIVGVWAAGIIATSCLGGCVFVLQRSRVLLYRVTPRHTDVWGNIVHTNPTVLRLRHLLVRLEYKVWWFEMGIRDSAKQWQEVAARLGFVSCLVHSTDCEVFLSDESGC